MTDETFKVEGGPELQQYITSLERTLLGAEEKFRICTEDGIIYRKHIIKIEAENKQLKMWNETLKSAIPNEHGVLQKDCEHEWVDARNRLVKSGEMCIKCWSLRAGNTT